MSHSQLSTVQVPRAAMQLALGVCQLASKSEESGKIPLTGTAVSGAVLDHWWWGLMVLDPAGCKPRQNSIPIDWCHSYDDSIGFIDSVQPAANTLNVSGYLVPYPNDPEDMAAKVAFKAQAGVPYQLSVDWSPSLEGDVQFEFVPTGMTTTVGDQQYTGPLTVVRKWPLNAVALCPHGYDANTSAQLSADGPGRFCQLSLPEEIAMSLNAGTSPATGSGKEQPPAAGQLAADGANRLDATKPADPPVTPPATLTSISISPEQFTAWQAEFSPEVVLKIVGGQLSVDAARAEYTKSLKDQNASLQAEITKLRKQIEDSRFGFAGSISPGLLSADGDAQTGDSGQPVDNVDKFAAAIAASVPKT